MIFKTFIVHKFVYFCVVDVKTLKKHSVKENKKPFKVTKTATELRKLSQIYVTGRL